MQENLIWVYLIHLSKHLWDDACSAPRGLYLDSDYTEANDTDVEVWDEVMQDLKKFQFNTLLIDVGDALQYETHPEVSAPDAWSKDFLKQKLAEIRTLGIEPIPKLNFSACHDTWLKQYGRMVSTPVYYAVCADLIREVCEVFGYPRLFHLGFDEESYEYQRINDIAVIRHEEMWGHDLNFLCRECEKHGARPWIWSDYIWHHKKFFEEKMSRSVLQSNWYYGRFFNPGDPKASQEAMNTVECYELLDKLGFEQIPTCSTYSYKRNSEQTVAFGRHRLDPARVKGYMTASWLHVKKEERYGLLRDAEKLYYARKKWYPETLEG